MPNLELRILKLRLHWKELILDEKKRAAFFEDQFRNQYDEFFLQFLFSKIVEIINLINKYLPLATLEQVNCLNKKHNLIVKQLIIIWIVIKLTANNFKESLLHLFGENIENDLQLEDDVRVELFLDNFKLHQIYFEGKTEKKCPGKNGNKYLKKILKLFYQWQLSLNIDLWSNDYWYLIYDCSLVRLLSFFITK